jgi:UDP-glucose 4-epimerase
VSVLITGGAGYIGAHVVRLLQLRGERAVVVDDLSTGTRSRLGDATLAPIDLTTDAAPDAVRSLVLDQDVTGVIHLAAKKQVGQSVAEPAAYYRQNVGGLANLLLGLDGTPVRDFVFSSSAAVYGNPASLPVAEDDPTNPVNPYGSTKLAGEWLVAEAAAASGLRSASLRYFNVAGAGWPDLGDAFPLNLLTIAIDAIEHGRQPVIFGDDFDTVDGTGVRDYVHVLDLADSHLAALDALRAGPDRPASSVYNVGTGTGASVREVLERLRAVSGIDIDPITVGRRPGDPAAVVADVSRIQRELGWTSRHTLDDMVSSAWDARPAVPAGRDASAR